MLQENDETQVNTNLEEIEKGEIFKKLMHQASMKKTTTKKVHEEGLLSNYFFVQVALALPDDKAWAKGLLGFYQIYRYLEVAMERVKSKLEVFDRFLQVLSGAKQTRAFEEYLHYSYGEDSYYNQNIQPSAVNYLHYLQNLELKEPIRLIPHIYQLYIGLFLTGYRIKILGDSEWKSTASWKAWITGNYPRVVVTRIQDDHTVYDAKKDIKATISDIVRRLSNDECESLFQECEQVKGYNLEIIKRMKLNVLPKLDNVYGFPLSLVVFLEIIIVSVLIYYSVFYN